MLIIGSAAGVVAMGMEKIDFFWFLCGDVEDGGGEDLLATKTAGLAIVIFVEPDLADLTHLVTGCDDDGVLFCQIIIGGQFLSALALAYFETGQAARAVEKQKAAIALVPESDVARRESLAEDLARFEAAVDGGR